MGVYSKSATSPRDSSKGVIIKKFLTVLVVFTLVGLGNSAKATEASEYSSIGLAEDGALVAFGVDGQARPFLPLTEINGEEIFLNHLGEYAIITSSEGNSDSSVNFTAITSSTSVELTWHDERSLPGKIFRDGEILTDLSGKTSFFDDNLDPGSSHQYELELDPDDLGTPNDTLGSVAISGLSVNLPTSNSMAAITTLAISQPTYSILRYVTFIRDKFVPTPSIGCLPFGTHFLGNDRNYNPYATAQDSKTILTAKVDWVNRTGQYWAYVGPTTMVTHIPDTDTYIPTFYSQASSDGLWVESITPITSSSADIRMHVSAANPDCLGLPIYANLHVILKRTGSYTITGRVRFVPYHEFYRYQDNTDTWLTIYRKSISSLGFDCFNPLSSDSYEYHCINDISMSTGGVVVIG